MIHFDLKCGCGHRFDAWFKNGETCEKQLSAGEVQCPGCGGNKVEKAPMAPYLGRKNSGSLVDEVHRTQALFGKVNSYVRKNFEDVGDAFPEEARRLHEGEDAPGGIYGTASVEDVRELYEDGVPVMPLPEKKETEN